MGRGPTGCDTAKPLIADESDPEIQLFMDESSPNSSQNGVNFDRNWPQTPTVAPARPSFVLDQQGHPVHSEPTSYAEEKQQQSSAPNAFDKPAYPPFDAHKYKPHPAYDAHTFDHPGSNPTTHFDQSQGSDRRFLVKREAVYSSQVTNANSLSSLLSQPSRTDLASNFYPVDSRTRPIDGFQPGSQTAQNSADISPSSASSATSLHGSTALYPASAGSSWSEAYVPLSNGTPRQDTSGVSNGGGSGPNNGPMNDSGMHGSGTSVFTQRRSVTYSMNGYGSSVPPSSSTPAPMASSAYLPSSQTQANGVSLSFPSHIDTSSHDVSSNDAFSA